MKKKISVTRATKPSARRTPQRLAVLEFLEGNTGHPSAEEIHRALAARFPSMSLSTVYNILKALAREGRVVELSVDSGKARFDPGRGPHHHLVCLGCRKIVDVHRDFRVSLRPGEAGGFEIVRSQIDFFGYCPECRMDRHDT
jgi:Fur family peroxide stress response transcriptional regulator